MKLLFVALFLINEIAPFPTDVPLTFPWMGLLVSEQKVDNKIKTGDGINIGKKMLEKDVDNYSNEEESEKNERSYDVDNYNGEEESEKNDKSYDGDNYNGDEESEKDKSYDTDNYSSEEESEKDDKSGKVDNYNTYMEGEQEMLTKKTVALRGEMDNFLGKLNEKLTVLEKKFDEKKEEEKRLRMTLQNTSQKNMKWSLNDMIKYPDQLTNKLFNLPNAAFKQSTDQLSNEDQQKKNEVPIPNMAFQTPVNNLQTKMAEIENASQNIGLPKVKHNVFISLKQQ